MEHWTEYTRFLTALLVILDPFAALPIFLVLTKNYTDTEQKRIAYIASITVLFVLIIAALMGETLLTFLGTSLASFRVSGGMILLIMAFAMLRAQADMARTTPAEEAEAEDRNSIAIVPLAIPLLAGPGSISTVIIEMHRSELPYHAPLVIACISLVCLFLWLVLRIGAPIRKWLGNTGINIINRLFGLILAAIAVEIMANGLKQLFPFLNG